MVLQFASGTKQQGISLFGWWKDEEGAEPPGPCHCRGADTVAPALLTPVVIRSALGVANHSSQAAVIPRALSKRNSTGCAGTWNPQPFYLPLQDSLQMGNFQWCSFDLLDGNCLPNGNLRPGDGGKWRGEPGPWCQSWEAQRHCKDHDFHAMMRSPSARQGADIGCRQGWWVHPAPGWDEDKDINQHHCAPGLPMGSVKGTRPKGSCELCHKGRTHDIGV